MEIEKELKKFGIADAAIAAMSAEYMPLKIVDLADKAGYVAVREARLICRDKRVQVEKKRKELKEDSMKFGKAVDAEAKRITALLDPIENYLQSQEDSWNAEKERLKQEAIRKQEEKLQLRVDSLQKYNAVVNINTLQLMGDDAFYLALETAKTNYEIAEHERITADKAKQAEYERIYKVMVEQEAESLRLAEIARLQAEQEKVIKVEQEAERFRLSEIERLQAEKEWQIKIELQKLEGAAIAAEQERLQKIEAEKLQLERERLHAQELEQAKKDAADAERNRIREEMDMRTESERLANLEEERQKKLLPDKEKLLEYSKRITALAEDGPIIINDDMRILNGRVYAKLYEIVDYITQNLALIGLQS